MSYSALLDYIRKAKGRGMKDPDIAERLYGAGWYRVDIQDALELYRKITSATPSPEQVASLPKPNLAERIAPHSYDSHLVVIAAVSFAVGFIVYLFFLS